MIWRAKPIRIIIAGTILLLLAACGTSGGNGQSPAITAAPSTGITYYLPETQLRVDAKRTESDVNVIKNGVLSGKQTVDVTADVKAVVAPDRAVHSLDIGTSAVRDLSLTVTVSAEGYLQGINTTSTGRTGDLIGNIFQIAGRVIGLAGLAANVPAILPEGVTTPTPFQCSANVAPVVPPAIAVDAFLTNDGPDPTWFGNDSVGFFYVTHSGDGCIAWKEVLIARRAVRTRQHELNVQQGTKVATNGHYNSVEAAQLEENLSLADSLLRRAQGTLDDAQSRYTAGLKKFSSDFQITPKAKKTDEQHESFTMVEVPSVKLFSNLDKSNLQQALLEHFPRMRTLANAGVVLARIDDALPDTDPPTRCADSDIAYREPRPVRVAIYQEDENKTFKKTDEKVVTSYEGPMRCVVIEKSAWAGRALGMEFGDFGVPKKLERTDGAALVAASGSIAGAIATLQNTYAESLEKVIAIQKSQREIGDADITAKIDKLQKQKALLDAQLASEGATASHDLLLQQQLATQQLATLQAQLDLQKAQQGSQGQLELADLKNRIATLEQQLLLLQAQKKLDDAKKP